MKQQKLTFKVVTDEKLSVKTYTDTLLALNDEYRRFSGDKKELSIAKMSDGGCSIDFTINNGKLILIDESDSNVFADFITHIGSIVNHLMSKESVSQLDVNGHSLNSLNNSEIIISAVKKKGNISISSGDDKLIITKDMMDKMQDNLPKAKQNAQTIIEGETIIKMYSKKIFFWSQTRFDKSKINAGNMGIIEAISKSNVKVVFDEDDFEIKNQMMTSYGGVDWQERGYVVDVEVLSRKDRIIEYKIIHNYKDESVLDKEINLFTYLYSE